MPQKGFEAFTPSHNYQVLSEEAAYNMGAVYADVYARKKQNEFMDNQIKKFSKPVAGNRAEGVLAMTKGHNSPIKFMGGLVGAASGLMGGSQGVGSMAGAMGMLGNGIRSGGNIAGNAMHMAMHSKLNKKLESLGAGTNELQEPETNPIESVVDQANIAPTGNVVEQGAIGQYNPATMSFNNTQ